MKQKLRGKCKLCEIESDLQLSHVIPASIYRWLKQTSGTGILRGTKNVNKTIQDGRKYHWLCANCEQKFGIYEKYFMEKVFKPINNGEYVSTFKYDHRLFYYLNSIWWRIIIESLKEDEVNNCKFIDEIKHCEKELRTFLKEYKFPLNYDKNYLLLLGEVKEAPEKFKNLNFIFLRTVDPLLMFDDDSCYLSLRIPRFYFFMDILGLKNHLLETSKIMSNGGEYKVSKEMMQEPHIASLINQRIEVFNERMDLMSETQIKKTTDRHVQNLDRFKKSKSFEAWINDRIREEK